MKTLSTLLSLFFVVSCLQADDKKASDNKDVDNKKSSSMASHPALKDPAKANEKAPDTFTAVFQTTKGEFEMTVTREWSPLGADRFYNLVQIGYFKDVAFFRAVSGFMVQFGIHGDPAVNEVWKNANIKDDGKAVVSNTPGKVTFAKTGRPDSRSVQFFINYGNNGFLDRQGFTPFGEITKGMDVVKGLYQGYGEAPSSAQGTIQAEGNSFLKKKFPKLDYIESVRLK